MRKRLKLKLSCCALCKPHKRGWENRWKPKELARLREAEAFVRNSGANRDCD